MSKTGRVKVLVVEDSADTLDLICLALKRAGAQIETATDGQQGIDKTFSSNPDILLLDLEMPEISGFGVIKQLRSKQFNKPIIAVTSHNSIHDRDRVFEAGFSGYIVKPFDMNKLVDVVNLHLPDDQKL